MKCDTCSCRDDCGLVEGLYALLAYIDNIEVQSRIKDLVSEYNCDCEYYEG